MNTQTRSLPAIEQGGPRDAKGGGGPALTPPWYGWGVGADLKKSGGGVYVEPLRPLAVAILDNPV